MSSPGTRIVYTVTEHRLNFHLAILCSAPPPSPGMPHLVADRDVLGYTLHNFMSLNEALRRCGHSEPDRLQHASLLLAVGMLHPEDADLCARLILLFHEAARKPVVYGWDDGLERCVITGNGGLLEEAGGVGEGC